MEIKLVLTIILVSASVVFAAISAIGVVRMSDFFCRLQACGIGSGIAIILCCLGLFIYEGLNTTGIKILFIGTMLLVTGPIGTHIVAKVAFRQGQLEKLEILEKQEKLEKLESGREEE